jgi:hypothetical protein
MSVSLYLGNLKDGATTIDFVKDLDIDMSNGKARMVLNALGLPDTDDLCGHMDRVQFANLCASSLQQHIGKQSPEIEHSITRGAFGATFIDCGVPEGYINQRIRQLSEAARAACNGNVIYPKSGSWRGYFFAKSLARKQERERLRTPNRNCSAVGLFLKLCRCISAFCTGSMLSTYEFTFIGLIRPKAKRSPAVGARGKSAPGLWQARCPWRCSVAGAATAARNF